MTIQFMPWVDLDPFHANDMYCDLDFCIEKVIFFSKTIEPYDLKVGGCI